MPDFENILKQSDPIALAQERKVDEAYAVYCEAAAIVSRMHEENGNRELTETHPRFEEWTAALQAKKRASTNWQSQAYRHGRLFTGQDK